MLLKWVVVSIISLASSWVAGDTSSNFDAVCPDAKIFGSKLISGICYDCMLPITLFGQISISQGTKPDDVETDPVCSCQDDLGVPHPGFNIATWLPTKMIEIVKTPFCAPSLGGTVLGTNKNNIDGLDVMDIVGQRPDSPVDVKQKTRYHVHAFEFPIFSLMKMFKATNCLHGGVSTIDLVLPPSELLPTWNDEELSLLTSPECLIAGGPLVAPLCSVDGIAASTLCSPMDSLPYCAGFWGMNCPMTGHINAPVNATVEQSLLISRFLQYNHRMGVLKKTYGDSAMCGQGSLAYTIPKQQYRLSMVYPNPEADSSSSGMPGVDTADTDINDSCTGKCCHYLGEHHWKWGLGRNSSGPGENSVYVAWEYKQCCNKVIGLGL